MAALPLMPMNVSYRIRVVCGNRAADAGDKGQEGQLQGPVASGNKISVSPCRSRPTPCVLGTKEDLKMAKGRTIRIENVLQPGKTYSADAGKYEAMRKAVLKVLPVAKPGLTVAEVQQRVLEHLPYALFPGGATAGWWMKAVQLDLEAKGIVKREKTSPLRLHRA
jgi:hypothetical protein